MITEEQARADPGLQAFLSTRPNMDDLRAKYGDCPNILALLLGNFDKPEPNQYNLTNGVVVSWPIEIGLPAGSHRKNPTYGRFPKGEFKFNIEGYSEKMTVLEGTLQLESADNCFWLSKGANRIIHAPAEVTFKVVTDPVIYICEYDMDDFKEDPSKTLSNFIARCRDDSGRSMRSRSWD